MSASIAPFFRPRSIAVIGASRERGSVGRMVFDALLHAGFQGPVFPINPAARAIGSVKAYRSLLEVPDEVDLVVIAVPADRVAGLIPDCAGKGVRAIVVLSAGFAETGSNGRALQDELLRRVRALGMRLIGPNCIGILNTAPDICLNGSFSPVFPRRGKVAIASQSGAIGVAVLDLANEFELGISTFASIGNRADVSGNDLLQYWEDDPDTSAVLLYLESFGNPRKFARIARRVSRRKPILAVKGGRTPAGSRAAQSHTAALASDDRAVAALFHQAGIIRAETLAELFEVAALLSHQPLPSGRRVAIITNAGGPAILCADACVTQGLELATFAPETLAALDRLLPAAAARANPVDMIASASAEQFAATAECVLGDPNVDALIVIHTPIGYVRTEEVAGATRDAVARARLAGARTKPVLACVTAARGSWTPRGEGQDLIAEQQSDRIPTYRFPEPPARALALAASYADWARRPLGTEPVLANVDAAGARAIVLGAVADGAAGWLAPVDCERLLATAGIATPPSRLVRDPEAAAAAAAEIGFPVAVKIVSRSHLHKTEADGVVLGLDTQEAVGSTCPALQQRLGSELEGFLVQKMVSGGVEVLVGVTTDPDFGPLIGFGLGGTTAEALNDVVFRITPLTDVDAAEMIQSIQGRALLEDFRGQGSADVAAIEDLLLRVSWLVESIPEVIEMDLNPVAVLPLGQGAVALDARIRIHRGAAGASTS